MGVYDIDGTVLTTIYEVDGTGTSTAYDVDGEQVLSSTKYSIGNIVSYYQNSTLSIADEINALTNAWINIIFITDPHGNANEQHSQAIALYLLDNTKAFCILLGGDYSYQNWDEEQYDDYMSPFLSSGLTRDIYALFGNHERHGGQEATAKQCIYTDFLSDKTNISGSPQENYYYFDNTARKIRFMFLNTSDGSSGKYYVSNTQLAWIRQSVSLPDSTWSLVVFGHVSLYAMGGVTYENEANGTDVITAIQGCNGTVIGYFCGHQHIDLCEKQGNMQHTTFLCDKLDTNNYYPGLSVMGRESGTTSEQAVSVISINTSLRSVVVRRIGAGISEILEDMNYTY